mmetsp:Transcript_16367/g.38181  ORF Transcript_16367/g.38181 Transcript_16367/m.38181 type:complete len:240 (+) Transcript_16367:79-798(+)
MACTSGFAYAAGDLVAQRIEGRKVAEMLDLRRVARNSGLGFFLHGPLVYGWIRLLEGPLAALIGSSSQWTTLITKIVLDQTFFSALINILYASLNGVLSGLRPRQAFAKARQVLPAAMVGSWRFWPAVQLISYSPLIPVHLKLLWIDTMEILWVAYLSATVNGAASTSKGKDGQPLKTAPKKVEGARPVRQLPVSSVVTVETAGINGAGLRFAPAFFVASVVALAASTTWPGLIIRLCT